MIEILLAPSVLFIPSGVWNNENTRDSALQLLFDYLDEIERLRILCVPWSDELECLLWCDPAPPPWRVDRDWKLKLVPIIFQKFRRAIRMTSIDPQCDCASFAPPDSIPVTRDDIAVSFCHLVHQAASDSEELIVGLADPVNAQSPVSFKCDPHALNVPVRAIRSPEELRKDDVIAREFWESAQVSSAGDIEFLLKAAVGSLPNTAAMMYSVVPSNGFIKDIIRASNKREIFEGMAKRVSQTESNASHDHSLHDEPVHGQDGIRRFRVSASERIHYDYAASGVLRFLNYYPEGKHDDGL